ncbi:murein biosynthesis integral membrane protein MurJ [Lysinibacillus odysseyi]|uniref:Membrane protein n=1 Tax=Lysinibacillus odysseyi 34hs-1 = NBRC 100172 TaxID=1220589 RepID=A0A0A3J9V3_9BACI|nr:lipid II flippase MurJ [Lysinibacillus odysseyi]KGR83772.1 membrane protein [Lysinibacillus odysseyi 34hs-1 = NBRC 100172]
MNKFLKIIGAVAIINIVARVFGFFREAVIGYQYGSSHIADGIFTAYTLPNFLYLVVGGAFTTALISIYNKKETNQSLFVKQSFTIVTITGIVMTAIGLALTTPILNMLYENATDISARDFETTKHLFYWMMPSSVLLMLASWYSGLLNIHSKFHLSSFAILIYNIFFLIIAVGLSYVIGPVSYGVSAFFSAVLMLYFLVRGYRKLEGPKVGLSFARTQSTRDLWIMVFPIMIGGGTIQIYAMLQRFFVLVLGLGDSAISAVNYASRLTQFPQSILITAVTTVIYPILSRKEAEDDHESIKGLYGKGLHYLLLLLGPVTIFSYFYAENLVQVILEYKNFTAEDTAITTPVVAIFVLSMLFLAANTYITRFYYAKGDSMTPVVLSLLNVFVVNIAVMYMMADSTGVSSIAWGTLISSITNTIMLVVYAAIKYDLKLGAGLNKRELLKPIIPFIVLTFIMYISSKYFIFDYKWITFIVGVTVFGVSTVILYVMFQIKEIEQFYKKLKSKLVKSN